MRRSAASPRSRRPSWTPRARSWGWRGCERPAGADRPRAADRDRPRAVRGLRGLRQGGARRVQTGRRVSRRLPRAGGGRARAAAARVRCLPRGRDRGVGRDRPPDRPRESRPKRPVVTGLRLVIPRDPWPRLGSERATRVAIATIYALVLLVALAEVARSLGRADRLDYAYYPELGEVVLSGGDPYANAYNTWPPFFLLVAAGLAPWRRPSKRCRCCCWATWRTSAAGASSAGPSLFSCSSTSSSRSPSSGPGRRRRSGGRVGPSRPRRWCSRSRTTRTRRCFRR